MSELGDRLKKFRLALSVAIDTVESHQLKADLSDLLEFISDTGDETDIREILRAYLTHNYEGDVVTIRETSP